MKEDIDVKKEVLHLQERKCQEMQEIALEICKMQKEIMTIEMQRAEAAPAEQIAPASHTAGRGSARRSSSNGALMSQELEKKMILNGINEACDHLEQNVN